MSRNLPQATNGRILVQMFTLMTLGGETKAIEQTQLARVSVGMRRPWSMIST